MKKIFAALCALLLVPTIASAGGERISVSELKTQTPAAVEGTHEAYGRTISFRAPVYVPDVDTLPILRVKRTCISAQTAEALGDSLEKNTLYGQRAAMRPGGLAESEASHFTAYVQNLWTSAADEAAIFAPNQEKSLRDAEDFLARQTETLLGEQQIGCLPYRAGLRSERLVRDGAKKRRVLHRGVGNPARHTGCDGRGTDVQPTERTRRPAGALQRQLDCAGRISFGCGLYLDGDGDVARNRRGSAGCAALRLGAGRADADRLDRAGKNPGCIQRDAGVCGVCRARPEISGR